MARGEKPGSRATVKNHVILVFSMALNICEVIIFLGIMLIKLGSYFPMANWDSGTRSLVEKASFIVGILLLIGGTVLLFMGRCPNLLA